MYKYLYHLLKEYPFNNQRIILDKSIDCHYKKTLDTARKLGYDPFIVRITVSQKEFTQRVTNRRQSPYFFTSQITSWFHDDDNCKKKVPANFLLKAKETRNPTRLFRRLDRQLK